MKVAVRGNDEFMTPPLALGKSPRRKQKEGVVVNAVIKLLYAYGCFAFRMNTGAYKPEGSNRFLRYGYPGASDVLAISPNGRMVCVECKTGGNDLSDKQIEFRARVVEKRGIYILCRDNTDALERAKDEILTESW